MANCTERLAAYLIDLSLFCDIENIFMTNCHADIEPMERICESNGMGSHFAALTEGFSHSLLREENLPGAPRSASLRAVLYTMPLAVSTEPPVPEGSKKASALSELPVS